jgi:predicted dienelactone hydrolase
MLANTSAISLRRIAMKAIARYCLVCFSFLLFATLPLAAQVGWSQYEIPGKDEGTPAITVALYYPSPSKTRDIPMGPFMIHAAIRGGSEPTVKGLIVLSHGLGGSELAHSRLAEALAAHGYLVAALRHPGDNWMDGSLLKNTPERYFFERPRQVSRVIDALMADPTWKDRIARDAKGPRIGALGHSAGGYTVLALAGGVPDLAKANRHCREEGKDDPLFCRTGSSERPIVPPQAGPALQDVRVRAVVAMAPVGVLFTAESLAKVQVPIAIYAGVQDRWLVPRFHALWVAKNVFGAELHMVPNAWQDSQKAGPREVHETVGGTKVPGQFCEMEPWLRCGSAVGKLSPPEVPPGADEPSTVQWSWPKRW